MKPFDVNALTENVTGNQKVWDIYSNGYTICVNQVEQPGSKRRCTKYKPHNISELSAFIAAIRPGFKSMYNKFEARENFSYGIDTLDNLLRTEELPVSFIFFQEQVMTVLNYAGFPMDQCYGMIKAIAKKHPEKVKPLKEKFIVGFRDRLIEEEKLSEKAASDCADRVWQVISDNCGYSFNSSHAYCMALDSLYQAWQKAYYPYEFYEVMLQHYSDKGNKDKVSLIKEEMKQAFGITEGTYGFRNDHRKFTLDKESHCIHPALSSIKGIGNKAADDLYSIRENKYDSFVNLLDDINEKTSIDSKELDILTKLGFFSEFGGTNKLLRIIDMYSTIKDRKQLKVDSLQAIGIPEFVVDKCSKKKTPKLFKDFDWKELLNEWIKVEWFKEDLLWDKLFYEKEFLGYLMTTIPNISDCYYFVTNVSGEKTRKIFLYQISTGNAVRYKIKSKMFDNNPVAENDIISISNISLEKKWAKDASENWIRLEEREEWATKYSIVRKHE